MKPDELQRHLAAYTALRQALGFGMQAEKLLLPDFVLFASNRDAGRAVRASTAVDWATSGHSTTWSSGSAAGRLCMARRFLTYLKAHYPETEIPEHSLLRGHRRAKPFLFTQEQLQKLRESALQARPRNTLRPQTLAVLLGLLASTGMRVGEARRLRITDVYLDHQPAHLRVYRSKFDKSRLVPLHHTTVAELRNYLELRVTMGHDGCCDNVFVSEQGGPLNHHALCKWFGRLCRKHQIWPTDDHRTPSLHSLRHTFAVERLRRWYRDGEDVHTKLPSLSVYLGHLSPKETYWYLTATPELLTQAASRFRMHSQCEESS